MLLSFKFLFFLLSLLLLYLGRFLGRGRLFLRGNYFIGVLVSLTRVLVESRLNDRGGLFSWVRDLYHSSGGCLGWPHFLNIYVGFVSWRGLFHVCRKLILNPNFVSWLRSSSINPWPHKPLRKLSIRLRPQQWHMNRIPIIRIPWIDSGVINVLLSPNMGSIEFILCLRKDSWKYAFLLYSLGVSKVINIRVLGYEGIIGNLGAFECFLKSFVFLSKSVGLADLLA